MFAEQRIAGQLAMIKSACLPVVAVVAALTVLAKATFMFVVFLMAAEAGGFGVRKQLCRMTLLAAELAVRAGQGELGFAMIERQSLPIVCPVAGLALVAQLALVNIIAFVAADTGIRQRVADGTGMATLASRAGVFAEQGKARYGSVIEAAFLPVFSLMAAGAIVTQLALVGIVFAMATDAALRQLWLASGRVATFAFCTQVFAGEREPGQAVIKFAVLPLDFAVAVLALQAERTFVMVIRAMAAFTAAWRLPKSMLTLVALLAASRWHLVGTA